MPELVAPVARRGTARERHLVRTRIVVDDFGDAVGYERRCCSCARWKPLRSYSPTGRPDEGLGRERVCRSCKPWVQRQRSPKTPEQRARASARRQERLARDPGYRERERERNRLARLARIARDPERERAIERAKAERHRRVVEADQRRHRERRENLRIDGVLRTMRAGSKPKPELRQVDRKSEGAGRRRDDGITLPAPPLAAFVDALAERERRTGNVELEPASMLSVVCERLGITVRTAYAWRSGERPTVQFDVVDTVLVNSGALWWDVYDEKRWPAEHKRARLAFEGCATCGRLECTKHEDALDFEVAA